MKIGRRQLDLDPLLALVLGLEMLEQHAVIGQTQRKTGEMTLEPRPQLGWRARGEFLVVLIDEAILVVHRKGIGDAHADILVGPDHFAGTGLNGVQIARQPAVEVLHGGDARGDHLEDAVEGVEIGSTRRMTSRVTNHSSSGMSGEPSCTGVNPI